VAVCFTVLQVFPVIVSPSPLLQLSDDVISTALSYVKKYSQPYKTVADILVHLLE